MLLTAFLSSVKCMIHRGIAKVELLGKKKKKKNTQVNICTNKHRMDVCHALRRAEVPGTVWGWSQQTAVGELLMVISPRWGATDLVHSASVPRGEMSAPSMGDPSAVPVGTGSQAGCGAVKGRFPWEEVSGVQSLTWHLCGKPRGGWEIVSTKTHPSFLWHCSGCKHLRRTILEWFMLDRISRVLHPGRAGDPVTEGCLTSPARNMSKDTDPTCSLSLCSNAWVPSGWHIFSYYLIRISCIVTYVQCCMSVCQDLVWARRFSWQSLINKY